MSELYERNKQLSIVGQGKKRDVSFDNMKGLLIFSVVYAHFLNLSRYPSICGRLIYTFIYFFHMSAFIFISGYFSKNLEKNRKHAVDRYLIPYFILTIASYIHLSWLSEESLPIIRFFSPTTGCWFLFVLFLYKYFVKDLLRIRHVVPVLIIAGLVAGFSDEFTSKVSLSRFLCFAPFYIVGYRTTKEQIAKIKRIPVVIPVAIVGVLTAVSLGLAIQPRFHTLALQVRKFYRPEDQFFELGIRCLFYLFGFLMLLVLIRFSYNKKCFLTRIGKNSMAIYVLHLFVMRRLDYLFRVYDVTFSNKYVYLAMIFGLAAITCVIFSQPIFMQLIDRLIHICGRLCLHRSEEEKEKHIPARGSREDYERRIGRQAIRNHQTELDVEKERKSI